MEENEEPFIAPLGLSVPSDVELPPTAKMHAIIERTANFVCKQGAQFEIMLKAKQARNSQFDFLRFDHYLNPYYKFIQKAMKEGRYTVLAESKSEEKKSLGQPPTMKRKMMRKMGVTCTRLSLLPRRAAAWKS